MKRPALQNEQIVILRMAFRARKVIGTFEKRAPEQISLLYPNHAICIKGKCHGDVKVSGKIYATIHLFVHKLLVSKPSMQS